MSMETHLGRVMGAEPEMGSLLMLHTGLQRTELRRHTSCKGNWRSHLDVFLQTKIKTLVSHKEVL